MELFSYCAIQNLARCLQYEALSVYRVSLLADLWTLNCDTLGAVWSTMFRVHRSADYPVQGAMVGGFLNPQRYYLDSTSSTSNTLSK